jgi:hypothetical protein
MARDEVRWNGASRQASPSLVLISAQRFLPQDDEYGFEGPHMLCSEGFDTMPRGLAAE